jgi:phosphatidylglycerophosphatase A
VGDFLAFRLLDILKPWPIGWLQEHVKGGAGIMLDDVVAAAVAVAALSVAKATLGALPG